VLPLLCAQPRLNLTLNLNLMFYAKVFACIATSSLGGSGGPASPSRPAQHPTTPPPPPALRARAGARPETIKREGRAIECGVDPCGRS
jgi:hypothetical protein